MRSFSYIITASLLIVLFSSCEKVIDIDLNSSDKKYVLEGIITDQEQTAKVLISQTKNFDEDNTYPGVSGALVEVTEVGGATTVFPETAAGVYSLEHYKGTPGKTYTLKVTIGSQVFTSRSTMPVRVTIDSIFVTDEFIFSNARKIVNVAYKDPAGRGNNYRFIQYVNGHKEKQILVLNDDYVDGRSITTKLFYFGDDEDDREIKSGDLVRVNFQCIDSPNYKFWYSLARSATGGSQEGTPANPVSNIIGGALGYFSAHTQDSASMQVP